MADVDELLRKQAQKHGLAAYNPAVSSSEIMKEEQYKEARTEHLLEVEDQNGGFAGFRKASEEEEVVEGKLSLEEYGSVEDLTGLGIDTLKEQLQLRGMKCGGTVQELSLIHISEPTRLLSISYAVFCLKKKKKNPLNITT
eukprot:TRINITY_DN10107_c0_g1_i3.p2 TRINITY_DN10107_c0_g1~~TRINITY_DN10107_c0_g1_i3.p2  ORF type:complete len:141 (+),score=61.65 TRINITY_DN10107_c0_g1_i3:142-564(+)